MRATARLEVLNDPAQPLGRLPVALERAQRSTMGQNLPRQKGTSGRTGRKDIRAGTRPPRSPLAAAHIHLTSADFISPRRSLPEFPIPRVAAVCGRVSRGQPMFLIYREFSKRGSVCSGVYTPRTRITNTAFLRSRCCCLFLTQASRLPVPSCLVEEP